MDVDGTALLDPADRALGKTLREETITFSFASATVAEALEFIRTLKNINVIINDKIRANLEGSLVTLSVTDLEIESALDLLLRLAGPNYTYMLQGGVVFVTDRKGARDDAVLRVHYIGDRPFSISNFIAPNLILKPAGTGIDDSQPLFRKAEEGEKIIGRGAQELLDLIIQNIAPESWEGGDYRISVSGEDRLVVVHTPEIQSEVARFINDLR